MASGIKVDPECTAVFKELKLGHKHSYVIYKMDSSLQKIVVDCVGELGETYEQFREKMAEAEIAKEGRYAVYDCHYAEGKCSKLIFIMWLSDKMDSIKQKMLYTSSKKSLKEQLPGIPKEIQGNDLDDLSWEELVGKCQSGYA